MVRFLALAMVAGIAIALSICPAFGAEPKTATLDWDVFADPASQDATPCLNWDVFAPASTEVPEELGKAPTHGAVPRVMNWDIFKAPEPLARPLSVVLPVSLTAGGACNGPACANEACETSACQESGGSCVNGSCRAVTRSEYREVTRERPKRFFFKRKSRGSCCP